MKLTSRVCLRCQVEFVPSQRQILAEACGSDEKKYCTTPCRMRAAYQRRLAERLRMADHRNTGKES